MEELKQRNYPKIWDTDKIWDNGEKQRKNLSAAGLLREKSWETIPSYFLLLLFGYLFLLGYLTSLIDNAMPAVVTDEEAGLTKFSEERAWRYIREIVGDGPRVAGTTYHLTKTADLKSLVDEVAANATITVHTDWQMISGAYWLEYRRPFVNVYQNSSNIIALLEGESGLNEDGTTNSSILFNCHYDSRPTSPGASDNALFCAVMVEVLSLLSRRQARLKHNIVFLFNGAEENPLQGAPGFLQHPWSHGVTAVVNLDSAGINCKSMLFQVTDSRVVSAYRRAVPAPSAQALGEVLFSSGIVPSDTDFRIFRDFGPIYGVDIAFSKMGHVYHTRHDSLQVLTEGVMQHSGDMLLNLALEMGNSEEFDHKTEASSCVYYDYLNVFMLSYSHVVAVVVDVLIVVAAAGSVLYYLWIVGLRWSMVQELLFSMLGRVVSAAAGVAVLWIVTAIMVSTTIQLRYLANGWIVVPIYWMPFLIAAVTASQMFDAWRCKKCGLNRIRRVYQAMAGTRLLQLLVVLALVCVPGAGPLRYVLSVPLLLATLVAVVTLSVLRRWPLPAWQHLLLEVVLATPALLFIFVVAVKINTLMVPIMGRSTTLTPDYLVAGLNMAVVMLAALPLSGIELLFSRLRLWMVVLSLSVVSLVVCFVPLSPYRESETAPALQRHNWFHSEIVTYNQSGELVSNVSGVWLGRTEVNTPRNVLSAARLPEGSWEWARCERETYCGLPMITPRTIEYQLNSVWVEFDPPSPASPAPALRLLNSTWQGTRCTLYFSLTGPPHLSLVVWPRAGVQLVGWSFLSEVRPTSDLLQRPVYFVFLSRATYSQDPPDVEFTLTLEVSSGQSTAPTLDVALNAHRPSHPEEFTPAFSELVASMPNYFNIEAYLSTRYNYVF